VEAVTAVPALQVPIQVEAVLPEAVQAAVPEVVLEVVLVAPAVQVVEAEEDDSISVSNILKIKLSKLT